MEHEVFKVNENMGIDPWRRPETKAADKFNPAFATDGNSYASNGLTKREYFAAVAFQGLLANQNTYYIKPAATDAVQAADALIAALNGELKPNNPTPNQ